MASMNASDFLRRAKAAAVDLLRLSPEYAPTPLLDLGALAAQLGIGQLLAKNEGRRVLGSFKSLGGTYAGLRALARLKEMDVGGLIAARPRDLPALICASDGNHGLAVAAAARFAGTSARIFLHSGVPALRAGRIERQGGEIVWVQGTYDNAVDAAAAAAHAGAGTLVADTTDSPDDSVVGDVMTGYGVIAAEVRRQSDAAGHRPATHVFVQAGVGGLAAAMAEGLKDWMAPPAEIVVVEPEKCACVTTAFAHGRVVRIPGDLHTAAEMLSCGEASAPAMDILRRYGTPVVTVSEAELLEAPRILREGHGPATTPSGAAGFAGLRRALESNVGRNFGLGRDSRVLVVITERDLEPE
ncbi:MAG: pyridoxal-phosphate dependent enzyme [Alphaproteobacteria bacterium]